MGMVIGSRDADRLAEGSSRISRSRVSFCRLKTEPVVTALEPLAAQILKRPVTEFGRQVEYAG